MKVPFTTADFLDRAATVYPQRTGVVDEPGAFQDGGRGPVTYALLAERAAALAAGLDELGIGAPAARCRPGEAVGRRRFPTPAPPL